MTNNNNTHEILASMMHRDLVSCESEDRSPLVAYSYGLEWSHSTFHWLESRLTADVICESLLERFFDQPDNEDVWGSALEKFSRYLEYEYEAKLTGIYGDGKPFVLNTYNGEDMLDRTLLYLYFEVAEAGESGLEEDSAYIILSVHLGGDVRGNYSVPRAFKVTGDSDQTDIFENARGAVFCNHCHAYWDTEDGGYSFHDHGINGPDWENGKNVPNLSDLELVGGKLTDEDSDVRVWWLNRLWNMDHKINWEKLERLYGDDGLLFALPDGKIVCPHCGEGILQGDFF